MARKAQSPSVGGAVKALPSDSEGKQQLSALAPFMWEQPLDVFSFQAGLWQE